MNKPNIEDYKIIVEEIRDGIHMSWNYVSDGSWKEICRYLQDLKKYCDELEEVIKAYEYLNFCVSETLVDQSKMDISDELAFEKIRNDFNELDVKLWRIRR